MASSLPERRKHRLADDCYANPANVAFLTICCEQSKTPFCDPKLAQAVVNSLLWTRDRHHWLLFCYCLMPDHLHFVCRWTEPSGEIVDRGVRGKSAENILDHVARFKSFTTREAWKLGWTGQLWQHSSYDRLIDLSDVVAQKIQYVLDNPVRAGLVATYMDWPYARIVDVFDGQM